MLAYYPNDGFIYDIGPAFRASANGDGSDTDILQQEYDEALRALPQNGWITEETAAVFVQFNTYFGGDALFYSRLFLFEQVRPMS